MKSTTCGHAETSVTDSFFGTRCAKYNSIFCCCGSAKFFSRNMQKILSKSSKWFHRGHFRKGSVKRSRMSPFHRLTCTKSRTRFEALQFQVCAISNEIQGKYPGKEVFLTKKYELKLQPDQCFKKIGALRKQKAGILGQVRDRVAESPLKERKTHGEIADLERNKPEVSEYKKEEEMKGFHPCLLLKR